jgi:hypothetical protein
MGLVIFIGQCNIAFVGNLVKPTMPHEVKDMPGTTPHYPMQIAPGLSFQPGQFHQTVHLKFSQSLFHALLFALDLQ